MIFCHVQKTLMLRKCEGKRRRGRQRTRWLDSHRRYQHEFDHTLRGSGRQEGLVYSGPGGHKEGHDSLTKQQKLKGQAIWSPAHILDYNFPNSQFT